MKRRTKRSKKVKKQFALDRMAMAIMFRVADKGYSETIQWVREHSYLGLRGSREFVDDVGSCEYERFISLGKVKQLAEIRDSDAPREWWVYYVHPDPAEAFSVVLQDRPVQSEKRIRCFDVRT